MALVVCMSMLLVLVLVLSMMLVMVVVLLLSVVVVLLIVYFSVFVADDIYLVSRRADINEMVIIVMTMMSTITMTMMIDGVPSGTRVLR